MVANEKNLVPFTSDQSREEAVKNGAKGGRASGEARRAKRTMREYADFLMGLEVNDRRRFNAMIRAGVPVEGCDNKMLVVFALMRMAQSGDVSAVKELRSILGEDRPEAHENGKLEELIQGLKDE